MMRTTGPLALGLILLMLTAAAGAGQPSRGTGIAGQLANLSGADFDIAYMRLMYQQHSIIANLSGACLGACATWNLSLFASKVADERLDLNRKLSIYYSRLTGSQLSADPRISESYAAQLAKLSGKDHDYAYARLAIPLMQESQQAAELAAQRASLPELRYQARLTAQTNRMEILALQKWLDSGFLTLKQQEAYCSFPSNFSDPRCPREFRDGWLYHQEFDW